MSVKPSTRPEHTAYIVRYKSYRDSQRALIIARNPIRAKEIAEEKLPQEGLGDIEIAGELRDVVKAAESDEVALI